tara:strand:+ start:16615 stop:17241 length:627 start_codon:yes stop_codon:yes gene_type:complete
MSVSIRFVTVGKWETNAYQLEVNGESVIIDPGDEFEKLEDSFRSGSSVIKYILNTHGHFDHIGAVNEYKKRYNIPFYLHGKDKMILRQSNLMRKFAGIDGFIKIPEIDHVFEEFESIPVGGDQIRVHHTPGHTPGSVTFEIDNMLISGDLFFHDEIGRFDLPGGNEKKLKESINYILDNYKDYKIYPGHGEPFVLDDNVINDIKNLIE